MPRSTFFDEIEKLSCGHTVGSPASCMALSLYVSKNAPRESLNTLGVKTKTPGIAVSVTFIGLNHFRREVPVREEGQQVLPIAALANRHSQRFQF